MSKRKPPVEAPIDRNRLAAQGMGIIAKNPLLWISAGLLVGLGYLFDRHPEVVSAGIANAITVFPTASVMVGFVMMGVVVWWLYRELMREREDRAHCDEEREALAVRVAKLEPIVERMDSRLREMDKRRPHTERRLRNLGPEAVGLDKDRRQHKRRRVDRLNEPKPAQSDKSGKPAKPARKKPHVKTRSR